VTDPALMRGPGWVRCCICGQLHEHPYGGLAVDQEGERWDVCAGRCAAEAGIIEARESPDGAPGCPRSGDPGPS
jgi:hypothetical protein